MKTIIVLTGVLATLGYVLAFASCLILAWVFYKYVNFYIEEKTTNRTKDRFEKSREILKKAQLEAKKTLKNDRKI
jgi:ABC-type uncharacterized transport system permease subunit